MRTQIRTLALPALVASAAAALIAWLGLLTPAFTDYETEAEPSLDALRSLHIHKFLELAPGYGGSLLERAPFAFAPTLWGGGGDAVFRMMAVPGLIAAVWLGLYLYKTAKPVSSGWAWLALLLAAANPLTIRALQVGHGEEPLISVLAVAAALAAAKNKPKTAGVLLGLAVAGKPWAALVVLPVLALLPSFKQSAKAATAAAIAGGAVLIPFYLTGAGAVHNAVATARATGTIFQPWQLFWFAGDHGHVVNGVFGEKVGYRAAPDWAGTVSHPAVILAGLAIAVVTIVAQRRRHAPMADGLLLLAVVLLSRCLLDTWNTDYYSLSFLFALLVWEVHDRGTPKITATATVLTWVSFVTFRDSTSPDFQAAFYLAWTLPLMVGLTWRAATGRWPITLRLPTASRSQRVPA